MAATLDFAAVLTQMGHENAIVTLDCPNAPWIAAMPVPTYALGPCWFNQRYCRKLVPWLRGNAKNYDAVVVRGLWQYPGLGVWRALRGSSPPYFVYPHGMLDPWFKQRYPLKHLKKWLYWPWAEYRVLRDARAVLFTCAQECLLARQSFWLYRCRELVVNYGVPAPPDQAEAQRQAFYQAFPQLRQQRLLLFMGRLHPKKGCEILLQAFAEVADEDARLHLLMAGPDQLNWQRRLQEQCQRLAISKRVSWTGLLSGDLKWGAFRAAEAFILPSHQENFARVVVEAMACGVPVLISDKINIWREIAAAKAGLVASDDLPGTGANLRKWLALPAKPRREMRRSALNCYAAHFELHRAVASLLEVINSHQP